MPCHETWNVPVSAFLRDANLKSGRGRMPPRLGVRCVIFATSIAFLFYNRYILIYTDIYIYTPMYSWNLLSFGQRGKTGVYISVFEKQVPPLTYPCFLYLFPICIYFTILLSIFLSSLIFLHFSFIFSVFLSAPLNILYP
jgi:hypothetical protein